MFDFWRKKIENFDFCRKMLKMLIFYGFLCFFWFLRFFDIFEFFGKKIEKIFFFDFSPTRSAQKSRFRTPFQKSETVNRLRIFFSTRITTFKKIDRQKIYVFKNVMNVKVFPKFCQSFVGSVCFLEVLSWTSALRNPNGVGVQTHLSDDKLNLF